MDEEDKCPKCKGEKIMEEKKEIDVKLDPGIPENNVITLAGEGHEVVLLYELLNACSPMLTLEM